MKFHCTQAFLAESPNPYDIVCLTDQMLNDSDGRFLNAHTITLRKYTIKHDEAYRMMERVEIEFLAFYFEKEIPRGTNIWFKWSGVRAKVSEYGAKWLPIAEVKREVLEINGL